MILIMNTGRFEHDVGNILVTHCANKNIITNIYTDGDFMIGPSPGVQDYDLR